MTILHNTHSKCQWRIEAVSTERKTTDWKGMGEATVTASITDLGHLGYLIVMTVRRGAKIQSWKVTRHSTSGAYEAAEDFVMGSMLPEDAKDNPS